MPTGSPNNVRGRDLPLIRAGWYPDEVGLCDALAAIWERLTPAGQRHIAEVFLAAAGGHLTLGGQPMEVWREVPWPTEGDDADQRMDLVVRVAEWGTMVIEAKVSQAYWRTSGPAKLPHYAQELRARVSSGREPGPRAVLVALTPYAVPATDVAQVPGVHVGATTWAAVHTACATPPLGAPDAPDRPLVQELARLIADRQLTTLLEGVPMNRLAALPDALDLLRDLLPRVARFLVSLEREAEGLGLVDPERLDLEEESALSPQLARPAVWWATEAGHMPEAFVGLALDLRERRSVLVAGVQARGAHAIPDGLAARLVAAGPPAGALLARWRPSRLDLLPCTSEEAVALSARPALLDDVDDWEWRGLALVRPWPEDDVFGPSMLLDLLDWIGRDGPALATLVLRADIDHAAQRPSFADLEATLARWPEGAELPRTKPVLDRPFGWTEQTMVDAWLRLLTDDDGGPQYVGPRRGRWPIPLTSTGLYVSGGVVRCCGVRIVPNQAGRKASCPVCGRRWWNRDVTELQP